MGAGWIRVGAVGSEARGDRKTRQTEAQMMVAQHVWYVMAGEISQKKYVRTGIEGIRMGAAVAAVSEK